MVNQLESVAKYYASKYPGRVPMFASSTESDCLSALRQLVEGAAALFKYNDLSDALGLFGETLVSLAMAWPGAASALREVADKTVRQVRIEPAEKMWKSVLTLRAIS
jgi:hypothetical protein